MESLTNSVRTRSPIALSQFFVVADLLDSAHYENAKGVVAESLLRNNTFVEIKMVPPWC